MSLIATHFKLKKKKKIWTKAKANKFGKGIFTETYLPVLIEITLYLSGSNSDKNIFHI